jgi:AraC-like DNA-binding protein
MSNLFRPVQSPTLRSEMQHSGYGYLEYAPSASLAPYVACYWTVDYDGLSGSQPHRIIPDGCVDIIVDRKAEFPRHAAFVTGLMTDYLVLGLASEQASFGIRMYAESVSAILSAPVSAFASKRVYLQDIWGMEGLYLAEELLCARDVRRLIEIAESGLARRLSRLETPVPGLLHNGLKYMYDNKGVLSPAGLADKLGFSERHMRRVFERELGLGPKEMLGIIRFQSMLREIHGGAGVRMGYADLGAKYGYYDQSHLIKAFKRYYGMSPGQIWTKP